jgi:hypothetical protein
MLWRREKILHCQHQLRVVQLVACHYIDWAIPTPVKTGDGIINWPAYIEVASGCCVMLHAGDVDIKTNPQTIYLVNIWLTPGMEWRFSAPHSWSWHISRASGKRVLALALRTRVYQRVLMKIRTHNGPSSGLRACSPCKYSVLNISRKNASVLNEQEDGRVPVLVCMLRTKEKALSPAKNWPLIARLFSPQLNCYTNWASYLSSEKCCYMKQTTIQIV